MLAAQLVAAGRIEINECPRPEPGPGEALLRVEAVGICPGDIRIFEEGSSAGRAITAPLTLGHEFSGTIEALGEGVTGLAVGERMAVEPSWHCGQCSLCARGLPNLCGNIRFPTVWPEPGAMAEYIAVPAQATARLPEDLEPIRGALLEPLSVSVHAIGRGDVSRDEPIAILGAGAIGLGVLQALRAYGVEEIHVAEPRPERAAIAEAMGATTVADCAGALKEGGAAPIVVFEAAGTPQAPGEALDLASPGGRIVVIGIPKTTEFAFEASACRRKEISVNFVRRSRDTLHEAIRLVADGEVDMAALPVETYGLHDAQKAFGAAASGMGQSIRIIVTPHER